MDTIEETMKKIASAMSRENSQSMANINLTSGLQRMPGSPDCEICGGVGYIRFDHPIGHPDFGKIESCICRRRSQNIINKSENKVFLGLQSYKEKSFDTFNPNGREGLREDQIQSLKAALSQTIQYANSRKGWLLLMGGCGCGKTHLAAAAANEAIKNGVPTIFLTVPDLFDWLRSGFNNMNSTFNDRFEEIRNVDLLVLDDLGTQYDTDWVREKLFQILNHRYVNRLATIVAMNLNFAELDMRLRSRFLDPELVIKVKINAPDYRAPIADDSGSSRISSLNLHTRQTFGNFSLRDDEKMLPEERQSLEKAFRAAQYFAEKPAGWLVLMGSHGVGKTHLASAIGNYNASSPDDEPLFVFVPDLLDHIRSTFAPNSSVSYDRLFEEVRSTRLLILDGFGTQNATSWTLEKLFQILNRRYEADLPTVITTTLMLEEIEPAVRIRMMDSRIAKLNIILAPPFTYIQKPGHSKGKRDRGRTI